MAALDQIHLAVILVFIESAVVWQDAVVDYILCLFGMQLAGFANSIVSPAMEYKREGYIMGVGAKMFTIAGPVLVYGTAASVVYGVILMLFGLA